MKTFLKVLLVIALVILSPVICAGLLLWVLISLPVGMAALVLQMLGLDELAETVGELTIFGPVL